jgi:hypothetical protein
VRAFLWDPAGDRGGGVARDHAAPSSTHSIVREMVLARAAELRPLVIADMGELAFSAARTPYVEHFARHDFALRDDIAHYIVTGTAAPGADFALLTFALLTDRQPIPGYAELDDGDPPLITVPESGAYSYDFRGVACSNSTANPTAVEVAIAVGGMNAVTFTVVRASADPAEYVRLTPVRSSLYLPGEAPTLAITDALTIRNSSSHPQTIHAGLSLWRNP